MLLLLIPAALGLICFLAYKVFDLDLPEYLSYVTVIAPGVVYLYIVIALVVVLPRTYAGSQSFVEASEYKHNMAFDKDAARAGAYRDYVVKEVARYNSELITLQHRAKNLWTNWFYSPDVLRLKPIQAPDLKPIN